MHTAATIKRVKDLFQGRSIRLSADAGVYAFWWLGPKDDLLRADRHFVLKGPGGRAVTVEYKDWWPRDLVYPCLYVGKSTNLKKRFALHVKRDCPGRLHRVLKDHVKVKPRTTSCQLRYSIEHVFRCNLNPLELIFLSVGFSYTTDFPNDAIAERFYTEDRLVGTWRPWFNIDSER